MKNEYDEDGKIKLKTILIGQSGVGKTNLINIARKEKFNPNQVTTVNCSFYKKEMRVNDLDFNVYLWDTIGQESLKALTKIFFKNAKLVILVYDITNKSSLTDLNYWLKAFDFKSKISRKDYWLTILASFIVSFIIGIILRVVFEYEVIIDYTNFIVTRVAADP